MKLHMLGFYAVLLLWLLVSFSMQDGFRIVESSCLTTKNTKVPLKYLDSYTIQHKPLFSVNAVRFLTIKRNTICSDPSSPWAIKAMKYLDAKKKPQLASGTARKSVTAAPVNTSTTNMTRSSAQIETQTFG